MCKLRFLLQQSRYSRKHESCSCCVVLISPRRRHGRSRFTLVAICGLLSSSTIYTVTDTAYYLVQFPIVIGTSERAIEAILYRLNILSSISTNLNVSMCNKLLSPMGHAQTLPQFVLSDVVLIWRAWCLWPKSRIVKSILSLCGCGSIGEQANDKSCY